MKVSDVSTVQNRSNIRKKQLADGSFATFLDTGTEEAKQASGAAPVAAFAFLNEVEDDITERKKKAVRQAHDLLDELEKIRDGIVFGTLTPSAMQRALTMINNRRNSEFIDHKLEEIINEIEVRASVELAKLGLI